MVATNPPLGPLARRAARPLPRALAVLAIAVATACADASGDSADVEGDDVESDSGDAGVATPVGMPDGEPVVGNVGPEGGTLVSADGMLTVVVPPGAVATPTEIGIEPITNECFASFGSAYRLTPDGAHFDVPVELRFTYAEQDVRDSTAEALGVAYQDADGAWAWQAGVVDPVAHTLSLATDHFTDFAPAAGLLIRAEREQLDLRESTEVYLLQCVELPAHAGNFIGLMHPCIRADDDLAPLVDIDVSSWSVNAFPLTDGVSGDLSDTSTDGAIFTAPSAPPTTNPVAVSVKTRNHGLLVANITVRGGYRIRATTTVPGSSLPCSFGVSDLSDSTEFSLLPDGTGFVPTDLANHPTTFTPPVPAVGTIVVNSNPEHEITEVVVSGVSFAGPEASISLGLRVEITSGDCTWNLPDAGPLNSPAQVLPPTVIPALLRFDTSTTPYAVTNALGSRFTFTVEPL